MTGCDFNGVFAPIPGFEGYEISTEGVVVSKRCRTHKIIKGYTDPYGYQRYKLRLSGGSRKIHAHRAILLAHVGPPPTTKHVAAHNDGNAGNNVLSNLRWATSAENAADTRRHGTLLVGEKNYRAKLTAAQAREIYDRAMAGEDHRSIAERLDVKASTVWLIANGRQWVSATGAAPTPRIRLQEDTHA